jgi:homocysteine S-methyltransferase
MPNSGYPRMENQRMVFGSTPDYFASSSLELKHPRLKIIGGCCGTTPAHINELNLQLHRTKSEYAGSLENIVETSSLFGVKK